MSERTIDDVYRTIVYLASVILALQCVVLVYLFEPVSQPSPAMALLAGIVALLSLSLGSAIYDDGYNRKVWAMFGVTADE